MLIKYIKHIFLGLTLLSSVITLGYFFLLERDAPPAREQYYLQRIQDLTTEQIKLTRAELSLFVNSEARNDSKVSRKDYPNSRYPYYLYQAGEVSYWSENNFVPEFVQIKDIEETGVLVDERGEFIVVRHLARNEELICVSLIPLYEVEVSGQKFNKQIFSIKPEKISKSALEPNFKPILGSTGDDLFYVKIPNLQRILQPSLPDMTLRLLGITLLFLSIFSVFQIGIYIKKHHFGKAFLLFLVFLLFSRWLLLANNLPLVYFDSVIFEPLPEVANRWSISLGDRLINAFVLILLAGFLSVYFYRSTVFYFILKSKYLVQSFFAVASVALSFVVTYLITDELRNMLLLSKGEYTYGILSVFDEVKIAIFLYYVLLSILFFLPIHACIYLFSKLLPNRVKGVLHWLYGTILSLILLTISVGFEELYLLNSIYFLAIYLYQISRNFYVFSFKTSLYFFISAFIFAVISTLVLRDYLIYEKKITAKELSNLVLATKSVSFEKSVIQKIRTIEEDPIIQSDFGNPVLTRERIVEYIKLNYFKDFVNGYQSAIYVFDSAGNNLDIVSQDIDLTSRQQELSSAAPVVNNPVLYRSVQSDGTLKYFGVSTVKDDSEGVLGTIFIELTSVGIPSVKQVISPTVFEEEGFNFALYSPEGRLLEANGSYDYPDTWLGSTELLTRNSADSRYVHQQFKDQVSGRTLLVSLPDKGWLADWGNVSFLFLISVFAISGVLIIYSFYYVFKKRSHMNFTTRIQLSLNTAFLFPLLLVLTIAISVVGSTLRQSQASSFKENTRSLASTVELLVTDLFAGKMTEAYFRQEIANLADNAKTSLALYETNGKQRFTNNSENVSGLPLYLNPEAFLKLIDQNERQVLLDEEVNGESRLASYISVKVNGFSEKLILGVPHPSSEFTLKKQLQAVVSSILNIFILMFLVLLLASFFVSRQLTNPIRTVTNHLQKTNLDKLDEPLPLAETADEMGILVRAYNRMLKKLEESKVALSNSEKQTAWREMAKQVAHEIKNPLTPMKLSIQQLQRTLPTSDPKSQQRIERALSSLNEQIDNISEIANSFSEFAKMPVPRSEVFNLVEVIQKTADLYMTNKVSDIQLDFIHPKLMVHGDRQLMSRVLTNLIINGLQSVPLDRRPKIDIRAYKNEEDSFAIVEVKDNGSGVPDDVREKVFIPNFSTKVGGSGLGLALAKRGIEHGGGNIWFDTELNVGTTFYVDLPLAHGYN